MRPLLLALIGVVGCADGPFARLNPNDPGAEIELWLESSTDTVSAEIPVVVVQVMSDAGVVGYEPIWSVTSGVLRHLGDGVFARNPGGPANETVRASFGGIIVTKSIHRRD